MDDPIMSPFRLPVLALVLALVLVCSTATLAADPDDPDQNARVDEDSALSLVWEEDAEGTVNGALGVRGDLAPLATTMALRDSRIGGRATIDFVVGGTASAPRVSGQGRIVGGIYENLRAGTLLRDLVVDAVAEGSGQVKFGFRGNDGAAGAANGQGWVRLLPDGNIGVEGTVDFKKTLIVRRDDITVTANGAITYSGTLETGVLSGMVEASRGDIRLPDPLPSTVGALDVIEEGPKMIDGKVVVDKGGREANPWVGRLDLTVKMPRGVFVRGRGLNSEWWGVVRVTGTTEVPRVLGQLTANEGTFLFAGREFTFREGSMEFTGTERVDPLVTLSAQSKMPEITAILDVAGWSSAPSVTLSSDPKLPQDEILSRIMFEKSVSRLTSGEALRLAGALKMLARGESPKVGIAAFTDRMLGVDVLALERQRRLAGEIRPRRGQDRWDQEQLGTRTREIEITPNISVAGESDDDDDNIERSKLGVIWKWDY